MLNDDGPLQQVIPSYSIYEIVRLLDNWLLSIGPELYLDISVA